MKIVFPSVSTDESIVMVSFTVFCGACGGILVVERSKRHSKFYQHALVICKAFKKVLALIG